MLTSVPKRRIDACRDILVGKLPLPTDQVELITLALIYKFMDDLDEESVTMGGKRTPAMEVLLNTRNIQELIEKGEIGEIKEAMEKSMSPGSQTFEQDLFRLVRQGKISTHEALANADSATNLDLLLGNSGIMPAMAERAKTPGAPAAGAGPRGASFDPFKISEESAEKF